MLNPPFWKGRISRASRWPEVTKSDTLYYPIWLSYATGLLERSGFQVKLVDAAARGLTTRDIRSIASSWDPEMIVVDTSTPSIYNDVAVVEELKTSLPNSLTVLVGPHVSALPQETLNLSGSVDVIAREEYDRTLVSLAEKLEKEESVEDVEGVSYRTEDRIINNPSRPYMKDLDEIPFVSKVYGRHLDVSEYFYAMVLHPMVQIMTGRGCPHQCTFCVWPQTFMGRCYRARSPENVVDEFEYVSQSLPEIKEIFIEDDTFAIDRKLALGICESIRKRKIDLTWSANVRADLDLTLLKEMKCAGCRLLVVGYESGCQRLLDNVKKGITLRQSVNFAEKCKKAGILTLGCFMIGLPGETRQTVAQTVEFAMKLRPDVVFFQIATPFPGTEFYSWCQAREFLVAEDFSDWSNEKGILRCVVNYPNLTSHELERISDSAFSKYYFNLDYASSTFMLVLRQPRELKRVLKAAKSVLRYLLFK